MDFIKTNNNHFNLNYRPDINGLRAIAVLAVIIFHINKSLLPGGFLGVDIFFVISGFLITQKIIKDIESNTFSIFEFYRHRIKRIMPAMIVVVTFTIIAAYFLFLPEDIRSTAKSAVYSLLSMANIYFWKYQNTGYFAHDNNSIPLLHLWSLGVEEQFYLLWPIILLCIVPLIRLKPMIIILSSLVIISFLVGDIVYVKSPSFVFYMLPPTRAGELLTGAVIAIITFKVPEKQISKNKYNMIASIAMFILLVSMFFINEDQSYPGWRSIFPTGSTALLIYIGHYVSNNIGSKLLSIKPLVLIGLISYSAYLWHWPLLAIYRYGYGDPKPFAIVVILCLIFLLSWLSYYYVEQPARRSTDSFILVFTKQFALPSIALIAISIILIYPKIIGVNINTTSYLARLEVLEKQTLPAHEFPWVCQKQLITVDDIKNPECILGVNSKEEPRVILWGDSHAAHYIGILDEISRKAGFRFRNLQMGGCPPIDTDPTAYISGPIRVRECKASIPIIYKEVEKYPVIIVSSAWVFYQRKSHDYLDTFFNTVKNQARSGKLVIILGDPPQIPDFDPKCREKAFRYPLLNCLNIKASLSNEIREINLKLKQFSEITPNVKYYDINDYLCTKGYCKTFWTDGEPLYSDYHHLNMDSSFKIGKDIVKKYGVPEVFEQVREWLRKCPS